MNEIKIIYNKWTCSQCKKKYSTKFMITDLCPDCQKPIHDELNKKLGTDKKLIFKTKIDYDKYKTK